MGSGVTEGGSKVTGWGSKVVGLGSKVMGSEVKGHWGQGSKVMGSGVKGQRSVGSEVKGHGGRDQRPGVKGHGVKRSQGQGQRSLSQRSPGGVKGHQGRGQRSLGSKVQRLPHQRVKRSTVRVKGHRQEVKGHLPGVKGSPGEKGHWVKAHSMGSQPQRSRCQGSQSHGSGPGVRAWGY